MDEIKKEGNKIAKHGNRLDTNRDSELVNRFVRMNLDKNEEHSDNEADGEVTIKGSQQDQDQHQQHQRQPQQQQQQQEQKEEAEREKTPEKDATKEAENPEPRSRKMSTVSLSSPSKSPKLLAKQINQELKKKRKRRRLRNRKNEEIYTDKDRAAAMSMGSKDIKTSLKVKHRQDRSKALSIPEEAEPGNFIALGSRETNRGNLKLGIEFYSKVFMNRLY